MKTVILRVIYDGKILFRRMAATASTLVAYWSGDMWLMLEKGNINVDKGIKVFLAHCEYAKQPISRSVFEKNLAEKAENEDFRTEVRTLITADVVWDFKKAYDLVLDKIIVKLPD